MRVLYTLKPTQNNPGSNYRPGCSAKPFLPSPFSSSKPGSKEEKLGFVGLLGGPTNPSGANLDKNHDGGKTTTTLRTTRLRFSGIGVHRHPPTPSAISTTRGCVCVGEGAVRGRRHRRVSLLLASIRALPFPRKGMRKRRVTRPARERNVACTA